MMIRCRRTCGFTLVEMLVVIAIISLLISILLPAMGKARKSAEESECATHLKNISQAVVVYGVTNQSRLFICRGRSVQKAFNRIDTTLARHFRSPGCFCFELLDRDTHWRLASKSSTNLMMCDSEHPGQQRGASLPTSKAAMHLEEYILYDILGLGRIAESLHGEAIEARGVEFMKPIETTLNTGQDFIDQLSIFSPAFGDCGVELAPGLDGHDRGWGTLGRVGLRSDIFFWAGIRAFGSHWILLSVGQLACRVVELGDSVPGPFPQW